MLDNLYNGKYEYPFTEPKVYFTMYQIHLYEIQRDHLGITVTWSDNKKNISGDETVTWERMKDNYNWKEDLTFEIRKTIDRCLK